MATVNAEIEFQDNNDAFFTTNAAVVYDAGIQIFHVDGRYKFGDGVTALSALPFRGEGSGSVAHNDTTGKQGGTTNEYYHLTSAQHTVVQNTSGTNTGDQDLSGLQATSAKDATGGYVGLTLFKINFKNVLNTFTSFFTNSNTAARTYTFPDKDGTVAMTSDLPKDISSARWSGKYWTFPYSTLSGVTSLHGFLLAVWLPYGEGGTISEMRARVTTLFAGSTFTMGLYTDNNGYPDSMVVDSGLISSATTGDKSFTISPAYTMTGKGTWIVYQVSASSVGLLVANTVNSIIPRNGIVNSQVLRVANVYGALPSTFPVGAVGANGGYAALIDFLS